MDQRNVNCLGVGIGVMFIIFGICMLFIGIPLLFESNKDSTIEFITSLCLFSSIMLIFGGYQAIKKAKAKDKALIEYQKSIYEQLSKKSQPIEKKLTNDVQKNTEIVSKEVNEEQKYFNNFG